MISKISLSEPAFTLLKDTLLSAYAPEIKPTEEWVANDEIIAVSYTHLTLPTIYSV